MDLEELLKMKLSGASTDVEYEFLIVEMELKHIYMVHFQNFPSFTREQEKQKLERIEMHSQCRRLGEVYGYMDTVVRLQEIIIGKAARDCCEKGLWYWKIRTEFIDTFLFCLKREIRAYWYDVMAEEGRVPVVWFGKPVVIIQLRSEIGI